MAKAAGGPKPKENKNWDDDWWRFIAKESFIEMLIIKN